MTSGEYGQLVDFLGRRFSEQRLGGPPPTVCISIPLESVQPHHPGATESGQGLKQFDVLLEELRDDLPHRFPCPARDALEPPMHRASR